LCEGYAWGEMSDGYIVDYAWGQGMEGQVCEVTNNKNIKNDDEKRCQIKIDELGPHQGGKKRRKSRKLKKPKRTKSRKLKNPKRTNKKRKYNRKLRTRSKIY